MTRELMALGIYSDIIALGIYCSLPNGRVRVPEATEVKQYCVPDRFEDCPTYRRHAAR